MSFEGRTVNKRIIVVLSLLLAGAALELLMNRSVLLVNTLILMFNSSLLIYWDRTLSRRVLKRSTMIKISVITFLFIAWGVVRLIIGVNPIGIMGFLYAIIIEACIRSRLIPTNTNYDKFFYSANVPAIITDINGEIRYRTEAGKDYNFDTPSVNHEVSSIPIAGGSVTWAHDLTELMELNNKLAEIRSRLSEENSLLKAQSAMILRNSRIESQTQIYEELSASIQPSLQNIIFEIQCAQSGDSKESLAMACFYTSYVKRRSNLLLIESEDNKIHSSELGNCLNETIDSLKLLNVGVSMSGRFDGFSQRSEIIKAYDAFQHIIEMNLDSIDFMLVYLSTEYRLHKITIMMSGDGICNRTQLRNDYIYYYDSEEDTHYFNISFIKERE